MRVRLFLSRGQAWVCPVAHLWAFRRLRTACLLRGGAVSCPVGLAWLPRLGDQASSCLLAPLLQMPPPRMRQLPTASVWRTSAVSAWLRPQLPPPPPPLRSLHGGAVSWAVDACQSCHLHLAPRSAPLLKMAMAPTKTRRPRLMPSLHRLPHKLSCKSAPLRLCLLHSCRPVPQPLSRRTTMRT